MVTMNSVGRVVYCCYDERDQGHEDYGKTCREKEDHRELAMVEADLGWYNWDKTVPGKTQRNKV